MNFNEREILNNPGKVSKEVADQLALDQYERFHQHRLIVEAGKEMLEDDRELKRIQNQLEKKRKKK